MACGQGKLRGDKVLVGIEGRTVPREGGGHSTSAVGKDFGANGGDGTPGGVVGVVVNRGPAAKGAVEAPLIGEGADRRTAARRLEEGGIGGVGGDQDGARGTGVAVVPLQEAEARSRCGDEGGGGAKGIETAARDSAPRGVVAQHGDGVLLGDGTGVGHLHIVNHDAEHVGDVVVAEGDIHRLPGIGAEVYVVLYPCGSGGAGGKGGVAGQVGSSSAAGGGEEHGVVLGRPRGVLSLGVPGEVHMTAGRQLQGRHEEPVVGGQGIVVPRGGDKGIVAVVGKPTVGNAEQAPVVAVAIVVEEVPAAKGGDILEAFAVGERADDTGLTLGEDALDHEGAQPVAAIVAEARAHNTRRGDSTIGGEGGRIGDAGSRKHNPEVLRGGDRGSDGSRHPRFIFRRADGIGGCGQKGVGRAAIDADVVGARIVGEELHGRERRAGVEDRGRQLHAPGVRAQAIGGEAGVGGTVAGGVGGKGGEGGGEGIAAAGGQELAGVAVVAVTPSRKAAALGGGG